MTSVSGKLFTKVLEKNGWVLLRVQRSHYIYGKSGNVARISVPVHGNQPLKVGPLRHLMKLAGLDERDL